MSVQPKFSARETPTHLIDCSKRLLLVPILSAEALNLEFILHGSEEVHLENDPRVHPRRIRQSRDHHRPTVHVGKIQSLAYLGVDGIPENQRWFGAFLILITLSRGFAYFVVLYGTFTYHWHPYFLSPGNQLPISGNKWCQVVNNKSVQHLT